MDLWRDGKGQKDVVWRDGGAQDKVRMRRVMTTELESVVSTERASDHYFMLCSSFEVQEKLEEFYTGGQVQVSPTSGA